MKREFLDKLGFSETDRVVMINSDDFGMCHSANVGTIRILTEGIGTSATLIVPCPWACEAIRFWQDNPEMSIGLELALTSEWEKYRWGPLAPKDKVPSLIDEEGYFWGNVDLVRQHVKVEEAEIEVRTQIERVLSLNLEPSHLDNHMGSLNVRPDLRELYLSLNKEYKLPGRNPGIQDDPGWPCIDSMIGYDLYFMSMADGKEEKLYEILRGLKPGLYELYPHCAVESEEIRVITSDSRFIPQDPDSWRGRISDTELYTSSRVRDFFEKEGIKRTTWRHIRDVIRKHY